MNRSARSTLSAVLVALVALFAVPSAPAVAQTPGGIVNHVNDEGYAPPIYVRCASGYQTGLAVGAKSRWYCQDAESFYVGAGQTLRCNYYSDDTYLRTDDFVGGGWRGIANLSKFECWWRG